MTTTTIRHADFVDSIAARAAVHQLLPPGRLHRPPGARLRARAEPGGEGRDRADPDQLEHVRRRPAADLPGHRHRQRVPEDRHGRALRGLRRPRRGRRQRRRAPRLPERRTTRCARRSSADPHFERKNTKDNTPAVVHMELVPGNTVDVQVAAKGGGSENKTQVRDAESERLAGRLGAEDGADDGRRLVPAGHARHRHRRHRREGDADGQAER